MTLKEKAAFLSGKNEWQTRDVERLHIPSIFCADGPHGIRRQEKEGDHLGLNPSLPATCFPSAATIANSWDESLGKEVGKALGEEAYAQQVNILLGPGLNIKRNPLCGRNFEYFSEDPYLSGKMAAAYIKGIQSQGVYACPKHLAVNSQELRRMAMNSVLDERTLREIYLTGFEIAVKEGEPGAIMTSYNEINGIYANENKHLLKEILRDEWKFDGIVITDWGASNDHVLGVAAGSDLEMPAPGLDSARELVKAVEKGQISMEELDNCVDRLLDAVLTLTHNSGKEKGIFDKELHQNIARKAASESAVLLKNEENILPIASGTKVAIIGDFAMEPRYQGAGSSMVNSTCLDSVARSIRDYDLQVVGISRGYKRNGTEDAILRREALDLAADAEIVIYCFGLNELSESEGMDRTHLKIPQNQIELLYEIVQINVNVVGVLSAGAVVEMPWEYCMKALLYGGLYGQAGASAMLDILTGKISPSGHLSETYPLKYEDVPTFYYFPSHQRNAEYRESIFVGYRYYDIGKIKIQYPFGYGLSYTTFEYSDINVNEFGVRFTLTNKGTFDGAEVAQLYVGKEDSQIFRPAKELKGFAKVFLKAGKSRTVEIFFDDKTFRYWNIKTNQWEIEGGIWKLMVGANVEDIRLQALIKINGTNAELPYMKNEMMSYYSGSIQNVGDKEFEELLGHEIPRGEWSGELGINDAVCQMYYAKSRLARAVYWILTTMKKQGETKGSPDLNILFIYNMPFRGIAKMTGGRISMDMVQGIVTVINGHFFKGMDQIIRGFFINLKANRDYETELGRKKRDENGWY